MSAVQFYEFVPLAIFVSYLTYGLVRPWISRKWQKEIEEGSTDEFETVSIDDDDEESVA